MVIFGLHLRGGLEINTFAAEKLDPVPGRAGDNTGWPDGPWQYAQGAQCSVIITPPVLIILIGIFTSAGEEGGEVFSDGLTVWLINKKDFKSRKQINKTQKR